MPVVRKTDCIKYGFILTPAAESRYNIYKNKLTSILRTAEKEHYSKLLFDAKGNIKDTWKILNVAMNKKKSSTEFPSRFVLNGTNIVNKQSLPMSLIKKFQRCSKPSQ